MSAFEQFQLAEPLMRGIASAGFCRPRPIQADTVPAALSGRDILGLAQTGTGKTAAFAIPILQRLVTERDSAGQALILAPTRELAQQIDREMHLLGRYVGVRTVVLHGGVSSKPQIAGLRRRPNIIIACPGRLLDLMRQKHVRLDHTSTLVVDEADHMFDMGFLPDINRILAQLPSRRQNLFFSATMPAEIRALADRLLHDPVVVTQPTAGPAETIEHVLYPTHEKGKVALLRSIIEGESFSSAIVFSRTKRRAKHLAAILTERGLRATALQGNMSQNQRDRAMEAFRRREFNVLVATDIASRGIDVAGISHVINFDVPGTPEAYTHRLGRTGRSEQTGKAITFVTSADRSLVKAIERTIGETIARWQPDGIAKANPLP